MKFDLSILIRLLILLLFTKITKAAIAITTTSESSVVSTAAAYSFELADSVSAFLNPQTITKNTQVTITLPVYLQISGVTAGSALPTCTETVISGSGSVTNAIPNCIYTVDTTFGKHRISFTLPNDFTNVFSYKLTIGNLLNPSSVITIDSSQTTQSFRLTFTSGSPTLDQSTGIALSNYSPGTITADPISQSNTQAGATVNYIFTFRIATAIPQNGYFVIVFPPASFSSCPAGSTVTSVNVYGTSMSPFTATCSTPTTMIIRPFSLTGLTTVSSTQSIVITFTGARNPNGLGTTNSFVIQTFDSGNNLIDELNSGLSVSVTTAGTITILINTLTPKTVDDNIAFVLALTPTVKYSTGGYIEFVAPTDVTAITPTTCSGVSFTSTVVCTRTGTNTVRVQQNLNPSATQFIVILTAYKNPLGVLTLTPFSIFFKESSGAIVAQNTVDLSWTTEAGTCTVSTFTRSASETKVGASPASYSLTFSCNKRMLSGNRVYMEFPDDQVAFHPSMTCTNAMNNGCTIASITNGFSVTVTQWCSSGVDCAANTAMSLTLNNAQNPGFINSALTSSVKIFTQNQISGNWVSIAQVTSGVMVTTTALTPGIITTLVVSPSGSTLTGGIASYSFTFTLINAIPAGGLIKVSFPAKTIFFQGATLNCGSHTCTHTLDTTDTTQINSVTWTNVCPSGCAIGTRTITVTNVFNPFNTDLNAANTQYTVETQTSAGHLIDQGTATRALSALTANVFTVSMNSPTSGIQVGATQQYVLTINNPNNKIPSASNNGRLEVTLPSEVTLISSSCSASTASLTLSCSANLVTEIITITGTSEITRGSTITLSINSIKNPETGATSSTFSFNSYFITGGTQVNIDSTQSLTITTDTPGEISTTTALRSVTTVNAQTDLTISFKPTNPIPQNAKITLSIPNDQFVQNLGSFTITNPTTNTAIAVQQAFTLASSYYTAVLTEWCSGGTTSCAAGATYSIKIVGFKNPPTSVLPTNSIKLEIKTNTNAMIDSELANFFATPQVNFGPLASASISKTPDVVGQSTTYSLTYTTGTSGALTNNQGFLYIQFPGSFAYASSLTPSITCKVKLSTASTFNTLTDCTPQVTNDNVIGFQVISIRANLNCGTLACTSSTTYNFELGGLLNPYNTDTQDGNTITIATQFSNTVINSAQSSNSYNTQNSLDLTIGQTGVTFAYTPGTISINSVTRDTTFVDTNVILTFDIIMATRLQKNGVIQVTIPTSQFAANGNSFRFQQFTTSFSSDITLSVISSSASSIVFQMSEWCNSDSGGLFCSDNKNLKFKITSGLKNYGFVDNSPTTFIVIKTFLNGGSIQVDGSSSNTIATPALTPAPLTINTFTLSSSLVAQTGVTAQMSFIFGVQQASTYSILIQFNTEIIRNDNPISCFDFTSGSQVSLSSCSVSATSNVINSITITNFCPSTCSASATYTLRFNNAVNKLKQAGYSGTLTVTTKASNGLTVSEGTRNLSTLTALTVNPISSITVTRSTSTQGAVATFTLTFTIPGILLDGSKVTVSLPLNQIVIQTGRTAFTFTNGVSTLTATNAVGSPTTTHNIVELTEWVCTGNCASGTSFTLVVGQAQNPFIRSTTYNDFVVKIDATDGSGIFLTSSPLLATPTLSYGTITGISFTQTSSSVITQATGYSITFTIPTSIPTNGKIKFIFPKDRVNLGTGTTTCTSSSISYTCSASFSAAPVLTISVTNFCPSGCQAGTYTFVFANGMKNPGFVPDFSSLFFIIDTTDQNDFIVAEGKVDATTLPAILPATITTASVVRTSTIVSGDSQYTIRFTLISALPSSGYFRIVFPLDQIQASATNLPVLKSIDQATTYTTILSFQASDQIWVDFPQTCGVSGCTAGTQVSVLVSNVKNPSSFSANFAQSSFKIFSLTGSFQPVDGIQTGLKATPNLSGQLVTISLLSIEVPIVNTATNLYLQINPGSSLSNSATISLYFPDEFLYSRGSGTCTDVFNQRTISCSYTKYTSGFVSKVTIFGGCPSGCTATGSYAFQIPIQTRGDIFNPWGNFNVTTAISNLIDIGMSNNFPNVMRISEATMTDFSFTNNDCNTVDQLCQIQISFVPINYFPTGAKRGRIFIQAPAQIRAILYSCQGWIFGDPTGNSCTMTSPKYGSKLYFTTSYDSKIDRNITIEMIRIQNPPSTKPTDSFIIYTQWDVKNNGTYYNIDKIISGFPYKITKATELRWITVTRIQNDEISALKTGSPTILQFEFELLHALETISTFTIIFPESAQVQINPDATSFTCNAVNDRGQEQSQLLCSASATTRTIIVQNYCQVATCQVRDTVRFKMYNDFVSNYKYAITPLKEYNDSLIVRTATSDGYQIDESAKSVFITPDLEPNDLIMPSPAIIRSNNIINTKTTWTITFKINVNDVPANGKIVIYAPSKVIIPILGQLVDVSNQANGTQINSISQTLYPDGSVSSITIDGFCLTKTNVSACTVGKAFQISIGWIKNPSSQLDLDDSIYVETQTFEGYKIERGTTPPYSQLFSKLIPITLNTLIVRPIQPLKSVISDYQITFSSDAEFSNTDKLIITFPEELSLSKLVVVSRRRLQSNIVCSSVFEPQTPITCYSNGVQTIIVYGLFTTNAKQYGVYIKNITNPDKAGQTSGTSVEVQTSNGRTVAIRSTDSRITIFENVDQTKCSKICNSCAGTNTTCVDCKVPSKYPIFLNYGCVDSCHNGYFFDEFNLECHQCHHSCDTCYGQGIDKCYTCGQGYFKQDGLCVPYCARGLVENTKTRECVTSNNTLCNENCETCSFNVSHCVTCKQNSTTPILDIMSGKCIQNNLSQCNNSKGGDRLYIDNQNKECRKCNALCAECYISQDMCSKCWDFFTTNIVNELYETCVDKCGLGTYFDGETCSFCNPVCLQCDGNRPDQCLSCNKTPEDRQLYLFENQCLLACPKQYSADPITNNCVKGNADVSSVSFIFIFVAFLLGLILIIVSYCVSKKSHKAVDITYALVSLLEFINRCFMLVNLWIRTSVFTLCIDFMNIIATCAIGNSLQALYGYSLDSDCLLILWRSKCDEIIDQQILSSEIPDF